MQMLKAFFSEKYSFIITHLVDFSSFRTRFCPHGSGGAVVDILRRHFSARHGFALFAGRLDFVSDHRAEIRLVELFSEDKLVERLQIREGEEVANHVEGEVGVVEVRFQFEEGFDYDFDVVEREFFTARTFRDPVFVADFSVLEDSPLDFIEDFHTALGRENPDSAFVHGHIEPRGIRCVVASRHIFKAADEREIGDAHDARPGVATGVRERVDLFEIHVLKPSLLRKLPRRRLVRRLVFPYETAGERPRAEERMPAPLHEKNPEPRKIRIGAEHQNVRRDRRLVVPFVAVPRKEFFFGKPVLVFKFFHKAPRKDSTIFMNWFANFPVTQRI